MTSFIAGVWVKRNAFVKGARWEFGVSFSHEALFD